MTTKDISKQICELVGIEPRKMCMKGDVCFDFDDLLDCNICKDYKNIYPDLTSPVNFVKLLECYCKHQFKQDRKHVGLWGDNPINSLLSKIRTGLKYSLESENCINILNVHDFKQALQQTQWEY